MNHDLAISNYAVVWGTSNAWDLWGGDARVNADAHIGAQEYVELYQLDPAQSIRLAHVTANINYWANQTNTDVWTYVDALHMSAPLFAKYGALTGNTNYAVKLYSYFHYTKSILGASNGLYNTIDHLWWRDATFVTNSYLASDGTVQKCYWSRGNGWAFVALARILEVLPHTDAHYAEYVQTFQEMAAALKPLQRPDGFWNVNLAYPNDYPGPESSGTSCFTYGFAWGINHGYLAANTYLATVIQGWNALANGALHHSAGSNNGFLGYEQGSGKQPSAGQPVTYDSVPDFDDFGLGLFLLAGSEVYPLSSSPGITLAAPVMNGNQVQLNFTVISSQTNGTFNLLQTDQLGSAWTTNAAATLSTNINGISCRFTTTRDFPSCFFRVQLGW